jgi:hypothetical protein
VLTIDIVPVSTDAATLRQYYPALVEPLRHLPGVEAADAVGHFPLGRTFHEHLRMLWRWGVDHVHLRQI